MKQEAKGYEFLGYPKNFEHNPISDIILKYVKHGPVLDIGCGNGNLLVLLKDKFDVEGFDISEVAVKLARKRGLDIKRAGIENFKTSKKFKTILMIGLIVLSEDPKKYLEIAKGWLDSGGVIMLTTPNATSPKNLNRFFKKKNKHHLYFPGYFEFRNLLKKNNFEILKCVGAGKLRNFPILSSVVFYIIKPKNL
jgi:2-polyprenyl-3-methyl-5-hydroxy-6-metoxy-1,4-benzoquinol methylase